MIERAAKREEEHIPADLVPRVRRVVTDVDKRRRVERGLERIDRAKDDDQPTTRRDTSARSAKEHRTGTSPRGLVTIRAAGACHLASADDTHAFGMRLGRLFLAGDLVVLTGGLAPAKPR